MPRDNDNSCNYFEGTNFEVWIGTEPITCEAPIATQYYLPLIPSGDSLYFTNGGSEFPIPKAIPNGRRLVTSSGQIIKFDASQFAVNPVTGIKNLPAGPGAALPLGAGYDKVLFPMGATPALELKLTPVSASYTTITYEDMLPLFSVNDVKYDLSWDTISFQNAGNDDELMARTTRKIAFSLSGNKVKGDTMNQLIEKCCDDKHLRLKCLYIDPSNEAREMYLHVTKESASAKIKTPFDVSYDFVYAGGYKRYDLTPS